MEYIREYEVAYSFSYVEDNFWWAFTGIYGSTIDSNMYILWELARLHSWWDIPWYIIGRAFIVIRS